MYTIWKYPLVLTRVQTLHIPLLEPLAVQVQGAGLGSETPCLWARVDTDNDPEPITIWIFSTGDDEIPPHLRLNYLSTFQLRDGTVWHAFMQDR
jgi:hypothetical protein